MNTKKKFISDLKKDKIQTSVVKAFETIDRSMFFDSLFKDKLYTEEKLPIGNGEHGENPYILAKMLHYLNLKKQWRILEIGTGSGYSTALLSSLVNEVVTIEYHENLAKEAKARIIELQLDNVRLFAGDGTDPDNLNSSFDAIIIFAACSKRPLFLLQFLSEEGAMVFPMGTPLQQQITVLRNTADEEENSLNAIDFYELCIFSHIKGSAGLI